MSSRGIKRATLTLLNLSKRDRRWIIGKLDNENQLMIKQELSRLENWRGIQALSFNELVDLTSDKPRLESCSLDGKTNCERVNEWKQLPLDVLKSNLDKMSDYGAWLIFQWEGLPNKSLMTSIMTDKRNESIRSIGRTLGEPHSWMVVAAVDWFLKVNR